MIYLEAACHLPLSTTKTELPAEVLSFLQINSCIYTSHLTSSLSRHSYHGRCLSIASLVAGILMICKLWSLWLEQFDVAGLLYPQFLGQLKNGGKFFLHQDEADGCAVDISVDKWCKCRHASRWKKRSRIENWCNLTQKCRLLLEERFKVCITRFALCFHPYCSLLCLAKLVHTTVIPLGRQRLSSLAYFVGFQSLYAEAKWSKLKPERATVS